MRKIIIAPNSFKGSISATRAADAIAEGVREAAPDIMIEKLPIADGGEGTVDAIVRATRGNKIDVEGICDPLGRRIKTSYGITGDNEYAVIEMAAVSGLTLLLEEERNPLETTTYGTGELIKQALDNGYRKIIIGVGGSATNDGGIGAAQALGVRFMDNNGKEIPIPASGKHLRSISEYDLSTRDARISKTEIIVACDVDNPLVGENGAARVYAPQKGASPDTVMLLEQGLYRLARVIKRTSNLEIAEIPGAGAAGGLAGGLMAFCGGEIHPGAHLVLDAMGFENHLLGVDLIVTGEGSVNRQTLQGKAPLIIGRRGKKRNIPVVLIAGAVEEIPSEVYNQGITAVYGIMNKPMTTKHAMEHAGELLQLASRELFRLLYAVCE